MSVVSACLPSDDLLQHLPSYLGFSYLGCGVSLHGCSSKAQLLLLTLGEGYVLTAALPDLQRGIAPLGPPAPVHRPLLGAVLLLPAATPGLGCGVACPSPPRWPCMWGGSFKQLPLTSNAGWLLLVVLSVPAIAATCTECAGRHSHQ